MKETAYLLHSPAGKQWKTISIQPHHGIAVPLFSLHTQHSHGIGEYLDLIPLIDWCQSIGFDVIQLLPLNDTGRGISPYSALSAFALNPLFLSLHSLPFVHEHPALKEELKALPKFSLLPYVDYTRVREQKDHFLSRYLQEISPKILNTPQYQRFMHDAAGWLKGYACFKILKKRYHETSWETWPNPFRHPTSQLLDTLIQEEEAEFQKHAILQFLSDQQFHTAKQHATQQGVFLMGDIPILIDRDSADVWLHQELFHLEYSAGAPPDIFSEEGQNWGFPIYNWTHHANHQYQWWKERLKWASRHYHLYRIDHIVGFFRLWSIPLGASGKEGYFIPQDESTWIDHGQKLMLMMLNACDMLPIGEDLGVVPPEVRTCLSALGICGTRVMRWERKWKGDQEFILPADYPLDSMTTVSTHDSETLQQWWRDQPIEAQAFAQFKGWTYQPALSRQYHQEILWDSHHTASLFHINPIQEYLALIPGLSWPDLDDERINIPGLFSEKNWRYRMRPTIEELADNNSLKHLMRELIV